MSERLKKKEKNNILEYPIIDNFKVKSRNLNIKENQNIKENYSDNIDNPDRIISNSKSKYKLKAVFTVQDDNKSNNYFNNINDKDTNLNIINNQNQYSSYEEIKSSLKDDSLKRNIQPKQIIHKININDFINSKNKQNKDSNVVDTFERNINIKNNFFRSISPNNSNKCQIINTENESTVIKEKKSKFYLKSQNKDNDKIDINTNLQNNGNSQNKIIIIDKENQF